MLPSYVRVTYTLSEPVWHLSYTRRIAHGHGKLMMDSSVPAQDTQLRHIAADALARRAAPVPDALLDRFAAFVDERNRPYIFTVILVGALGYLLFAVGDFVVIRDMFTMSLTLRILFAVTVISLTALLVRRANNLSLLEALGALYVHIATVIWFFLLYGSEGSQIGVYAHASVIFVLWMNLGICARFTTAVVSSLTLTLVVLYGVWIVNDGNLLRFFIYSTLHASVLVFSLVVSWFHAFNQRRLFLLGVIDKVNSAELKHANRQLWTQAHTDTLTGLPNRALLEDRLTQALANARRDERKLAVLFVDLDRFKPVNDTYGHAVGDHLLVQVAQRMRALIRESDTVARFGGDEFVVVLSGLKTGEVATNKANEIIRALTEPFRVEGLEISIGCSIGIALYPDHGNDELSLQQVADRAVYEAKEYGRNCARVGCDLEAVSSEDPL